MMAQALDIAQPVSSCRYHDGYGWRHWLPIVKMAVSNRRQR